MSAYDQAALDMHQKHGGKMEIKSKIPVETKNDLSTAYTPGVAAPCLAIAEDKQKAYTYTCKSNMVVVVSDGSAVLGLGNIGPEAAMPVMEGKAILFKEFANVDAFPICLATQDTEEIIQTVKNIAPGFGGINLEDISAPRCFEIENRLKEELDIPVFHDDQHGTAIVVLAGLINALKITGKNKEDLVTVVSGVGAAGIAITKLLMSYGLKHFYMCDSRGLIYEGRPEGMNPVKEEMAKITNLDKKSGDLAVAMQGADLFIGVSQPDVLTPEMVKTMNADPIVFAMSNPNPEIKPELAHEAGVAIMATGRSDYPNQINNVLAFPGLFRGVLDARARKITEPMKIAAAEAIASHIDNPTAEAIIPCALDKSVAVKVAEAVKNAV
jgi:malate dehydrogenase (oxaloacetate-decarboxylating)